MDKLTIYLKVALENYERKISNIKQAQQNGADLFYVLKLCELSNMQYGLCYHIRPNISSLKGVLMSLLAKVNAAPLEYYSQTPKASFKIEEVIVALEARVELLNKLLKLIEDEK